MNINTPFECQHEPFRIHLLASAQGASLNVFMDSCCDVFSTCKGKCVLHAELVREEYAVTSVGFIFVAHSITLMKI